MMGLGLSCIRLLQVCSNAQHGQMHDSVTLRKFLRNEGHLEWAYLDYIMH